MKNLIIVFCLAFVISACGLIGILTTYVHSHGSLIGHQ